VRDYDEAWSDRDVEPQRLSGLSRRRMQTLIRDFFGISKGTLIAEIYDLENQATLSPELLEALHHDSKYRQHRYTSRARPSHHCGRGGR